MKHTQHNDPFEYSSHKDNSFWDFSWENDKWVIALLSAMILIGGVIFIGMSLIS